MSASQKKIFELVANHGCLPRLPGPWAGKLCAHGFMGAISVGDELLRKLKARFSAEDLVASGVAVLDDHGEVRLQASLVGRHALFFVARSAETAAPLDLVVADGKLSGNLPALSMLSDYRTQLAMQDNHNELFVAFSLLDAAILKTFGLPVILADGLERMGGKHLDGFCKLLGLDRRPPTEAEIDRQSRRFRPREHSTERAPPTLPSFPGTRRNLKPPQRPISLTFVSWSVAILDLTEPARLCAVQDHLQQLVAHLGIELDHLRVWQPSLADLERLHFSLAYGDMEDFSTALQESVEMSCTDLVRPNPGQDCVPQTYAEALMAWIAAGRESGDAERKKRLSDQMQRLHDVELIQPLLERARDTPDAVEGNLLNVFAQLCRTFTPQAAILASQCGQAAREFGSKASIAPAKDELQRVLALADRVRAIAQELTPCKTKNKRS